MPSKYPSEFISPLFGDLAKPAVTLLEKWTLTGDDYNRSSEKPLIAAVNALEAALVFLNEFRDSPATLRVYAKELERLFLWCKVVPQVSIASLRREHLLAYQQFLQKPIPKKRWCGTKVPRLLFDGVINPAWRVFYKPLSDVSTHKALTIIDSFFNYLVQSHYLLGNPMAMDRRRKKRKKPTANIIDRYLALDEIHAVLEALKEYPSKTDDDKFRVARAAYIILLLFYTGLRISEASGHKMGNFLQRENEWFLRVSGKGKKVREIPIPDALLDALAAFRKAVGLPSPSPKYREQTPLIPMQNLTTPISTRRVTQILKWAFGLGAIQFEQDAPHKASKLKTASAHWLRHSYVTYLLEAGASLKVTQENAGHSNVATTMHYQHVAQINRHEQTRLLSLTPTIRDNN